MVQRLARLSLYLHYKQEDDRVVRRLARSVEPYVDFLLDLLWGQECILAVQVELSLHDFGAVELALDAALHQTTMGFYRVWTVFIQLCVYHCIAQRTPYRPLRLRNFTSLRCVRLRYAITL